MAEKETKTVLLDVQINDKINETLNKIAELNQNHKLATFRIRKILRTVW